MSKVKESGWMRSWIGVMYVVDGKSYLKKEIISKLMDLMHKYFYRYSNLRLTKAPLQFCMCNIQ